MVWSLQSLPALSEKQFDLWNKLLEERTGIQILPQQRALLQTQLGMRMRELGIDAYNTYYDQVLTGVVGTVEWSILVDRLMVKETRFFRHRQSIEFVRREIQQRIDNQSHHNNFEIWSVGCSSGEEPYSLAMVTNDCFELARMVSCYGITATDISGSALAVAKQGVYASRRLENVSEYERQRYFIPLTEGRFQVVDKLRQRLCFSQGNILNVSTMPKIEFDVIFCQNLLAYFRRERRKELLSAFTDRLKVGGILVIGLGEIMDWQHPAMQRVADSQIQAYIKC